MKRKFSDNEVLEHMQKKSVNLFFKRIYFNKEDLNIFVKRTAPFSWTMNLGNIWSWVIIGAEILAVVLIVTFWL